MISRIILLMAIGLNCGAKENHGAPLSKFFEFECFNEGKNISRAGECNGHEDCPDGSDEFQCPNVKNPIAAADGSIEDKDAEISERLANNPSKGSTGDDERLYPTRVRKSRSRKWRSKSRSQKTVSGRIGGSHVKPIRSSSYDWDIPMRTGSDYPVGKPRRTETHFNYASPAYNPNFLPSAGNSHAPSDRTSSHFTPSNSSSVTHDTHSDLPLWAIGLCSGPFIVMICICSVLTIAACSAQKPAPRSNPNTTSTTNACQDHGFGPKVTIASMKAPNSTAHGVYGTSYHLYPSAPMM